MQDISINTIKVPKGQKAVSRERESPEQSHTRDKP
jgi:hypothetical protein